MKILLVSTSQKNTETLTGLIKETPFNTTSSQTYSQLPEIIYTSSGSEARRTLASCEFDLVLIDSPLRDENGNQLALKLAEDTISGIILLASRDTAMSVASSLEPCGIILLEKPLGRGAFYQGMHLAFAVHSRMLHIKEHNDKLQSKLDEIRIIDRAKCVLIQYLNMTEPQAHRYIEKQAMNMRCTRKELALGIIKNYEN